MNAFARSMCLLVLACSLALGACTPASPPAIGTRPQAARLEPVSGAYFGVNLDWDAESPSAFNEALGHRAAVYVRFFAFPMGQEELATFDRSVKAVAAENGMLLVTLEPMQGLDAVTPEAAKSLAERLALANQAGVSTFVRFAHEMNGSWYPWGQQPIAYVESFRMLANEVHKTAPGSAMLWAPNYGGGYPFEGGQYGTQPGDPGFGSLDTNDDGQLDMRDDPYGPYYPGDEAVDWVGLSLYHWGSTYPWGEDELPEQNKFTAQLHGEYRGLNGDDSAIPDFYATYWIAHNKPVAIPETAAFYDPAQTNVSELMLKQAWWRQVLDPSSLAVHPGIKMIDWFEWNKAEAEAGGALIDWRVLGSPPIAEQFRRDLPVDHLIFAP